ncbi:trigger factor [Spirochaetia bacterium]|nr:trigger factor [Spirochaetia bacterium]
MAVEKVERKIENLEKSSVKLTWTIKNEDLKQKYTEIVGDFAKTVQIKGFRKGKVPVSVLERKFGKDLLNDVLNSIISKTVTGTFEGDDFPAESKPLPYSDPQVDGTPVLDLATDLTFSVTYDVMPTVKIEKWEGFEVEIDEAEITDADIERELGKIQDRNAIVIDKDENNFAAKNDIVSINYSELDENDKEIKGTARQDFVWTLGTGANYFKIDDEVTGMRMGETRDITKTFAADDTNEELAGKTKKLRVKINSLKQKDLPKLDDDFAQDVDEKFKTLADLKASIRERLTKQLNDELEVKKTNALLKKLVEANPMQIPESMINLELAQRLRQFTRNMNMPDEDLGRIFADKDNPILASWRPGVIDTIHSSFIVEELIKAQNIESGDADIEKEIEKTAAETGEPLDEIKKYYETPQAREYMQDSIKRKKIFDIILSKNKIKKGKKVNFVDIFPERY